MFYILQFFFLRKWWKNVGKAEKLFYILVLKTKEEAVITEQNFQDT